MTKVTSVRLSEDLTLRLDELAVATDRSRGWLIEQAITRFVDEESWQVAAIREALTDYQAGRMTLISHEDIVHRVGERMREWASDANPVE